MRTITHMTHVHPPGKRGLVAKGWTFFRHFLEICAVMCVGAVTLSFIFFGVAWLMGFRDLVDETPEFSTLVLAVNLALPMIAWMRFRGHEWRPTLEMAVAPVVLGVLLIVAGWLDIIPRNEVFELETSLACLSMLIPMLFRLDLYVGGKGHYGHAVPSSHARS
jgi:hypothetical protein